MNKRIVIMVILLVVVMLSAVSPWPSILTVINYTGQNVYITLKYHGVQKYFLTATKAGNTDDWNISRFDVERYVYDARVIACDTTTTWSTMDMDVNLRLTFTTCDQMKQYWTPKYWGEPSLEKPNFWHKDDLESVPPDNSWYAGAPWTEKYRYITFVHLICNVYHYCRWSGLHTRTFLFLYDVTDTD